jgi:hypothetical protein
MDRSGVNLTDIRFPSDGLTIGALRRAHPDRFDTPPVPTFFLTEPRGDCADLVLGTVLGLERALAADAYNRAAGQGWKDVALGYDRGTFAADLGEWYVRYGLARGGHHAEQLIRAFEAQAAGQVRRR